MCTFNTAQIMVVGQLFHFNVWFIYSFSKVRRGTRSLYCPVIRLSEIFTSLYKSSGSFNQEKNMGFADSCFANTPIKDFPCHGEMQEEKRAATSDDSDCWKRLLKKEYSSFHSLSQSNLQRLDSIQCSILGTCRCLSIFLF